jgi:hypothetical protein
MEKKIKKELIAKNKATHKKKTEGFKKSMGN